MKYKGVLTKIRSNYSNLRDDVIEGETFVLPEVGKSFTLFGKPRDIPFGYRQVSTTVIQNVEKMEKEYLFNTLNSTYKFEVTDELDTTEENNQTSGESQV